MPDTVLGKDIEGNMMYRVPELRSSYASVETHELSNKYVYKVVSSSNKIPRRKSRQGDGIEMKRRKGLFIARKSSLKR